MTSSPNQSRPHFRKTLPRLRLRPFEHRIILPLNIYFLNFCRHPTRRRPNNTKKNEMEGGRFVFIYFVSCVFIRPAAGLPGAGERIVTVSFLSLEKKKKKKGETGRRNVQSRLYCYHYYNHD